MHVRPKPALSHRPARHATRVLGGLLAAGAVAFSPSALATVPSPELTPEEQAQGFQNAWNGGDLSEWHTAYEPDGTVFRAWSVPQRGYLQLRKSPRWSWQKWILFGQRRNPGGGSIATNDRTYRSFHLKLQYRLEERGTNSGVFLFSDETKPRTLFDVSPFGGMEVQIYDDSLGLARGLAALNPFETKKLTGDIYGGPRVPAGTNKGLNPVGEWNELEVIVSDARYVTVITNGNTLLSRLDVEAHPALNAEISKKRATGSSIILQDEGRKITYRGIKVRRL